MSDKLLFTCRVCGTETDTHPTVENEIGEQIGVQGVCPEHCEDHDYQYDDMAGDHFCIHCNARAPYDWLQSDDDVVYFGGSASGPIGTPASAMNGNAAARHTDPAAWDSWVAFCQANGHD